MRVEARGHPWVNSPHLIAFKVLSLTLGRLNLMCPGLVFFSLLNFLCMCLSAPPSSVFLLELELPIHHFTLQSRHSAFPSPWQSFCRRGAGSRLTCTICFFVMCVFSFNVSDSFTAATSKSDYLWQCFCHLLMSFSCLPLIVGLSCCCSQFLIMR